MKDLIKVNILTGQERELRSVQDYRLMYVLGGSLHLTVNGDRVDLKEGGLYMLPQMSACRAAIGDQSLAAELLVSYHELTTLTKTPLMEFVCNSNREDRKYDELRRMVRRMLAYHTYSGSLDKIREKVCCYEIVHLLVRDFAKTGEQLVYSQEEKGKDRLETIVEYLQVNYMRQISLQDLSKWLYLSVPYLSKLIKKQLNMGFLDYLNRIRLQHAVDDLEGTDHSITQIAFDNGFANLTSFNRVFKEAYGITPSTFKQKVKVERREAAESQERGLQQLRHFFEVNPYREDDESGSVQICRADARSHGSYYKYWQNVFNLGAAEDLLRSDVQGHIKTIKKELDIQHGRIWRLFNRSTYVDVTSKGKFNFSKLDIVLDFLLDNRITPFLDLGFKYKQLIWKVGGGSGDTIRMIDKDEPHITEMHQYERLLVEFLKHCIRRYGADVVESWRFELWWDERDKEDWFHVFEVAYQCIKAYIPGTQVGAAA